MAPSLLLGWTGMRGVVSLAAALSIPLKLHNGAAFPYRNLILFVTFMVILFTLLIQGLTLPYFIKRSGYFENSDELPEEEIKLKIRNELAVYTVKLLKENQGKEVFNDTHLQRMLSLWETKIKQPENFKMNAEAKQHYLDVLENQRQFLAGLNKGSDLDENCIRNQVFQIDLEEERIKLL